MTDTNAPVERFDVWTEDLPRNTEQSEHERVVTELLGSARVIATNRGWKHEDCTVLTEVVQDGDLFERNRYRVTATVEHRPRLAEG